MDGQLKIAQLKLQKGQKSLERPKKRKKQNKKTLKVPGEKQKTDVVDIFFNRFIAGFSIFIFIYLATLGLSCGLWDLGCGTQTLSLRHVQSGPLTRN